MLRSILYDILHQHEEFFYIFQSEYRRQAALQERSRGDVIEWHYDSLKRVLLSLCDYSPAERLYLIIDAVDESDDKDRREILELLFSLCLKTKHCVVKVFVASRPVGTLESRIDELNFIRLQDQTSQDISRFAGDYLKRLKFTGSFEKAMKYIVDNAQGVFLWVKLVGEELLTYYEEGRAEKDVLDFLKSLPTELENFYGHMLLKMGRNRADVETGVKMFRFVLFACRPLTVSELLHALAIPDNPDIEFEASDEYFHESIPRERRITLCGGNFLEIRQHLGTTTGHMFSNSLKANEPAGSGSVQVMHQTVREFFLLNNGCVASSEFRVSEEDAHICISITCIRYLMLCAANMMNRLPIVKYWTLKNFESYAQYLNERPFASYALSYLKDHIDGCCGDAAVLRLVSQFIDELTSNQADYLLGGCVKSYLKETRLSSYGSSAADDFRNKALHAAVIEGFPQAVEMLLISGADANSKEELERTPLSWAAELGHEAVLRLLLETGKVNVESKDQHGQTPLLWAIKRGREAVVKLLLEIGKVDVEYEDKYGRTPLLWAVGQGHVAVVKLLLEISKVNVETEDKYGQTPLSLAADRGHEAVVKLLLETGKVDVESKDESGQTPLSLAVERGHDAVVKLLLDTGKVDVKSKGRYGETPLSLAAERGHEAVVRLLLETGKVDVESQDENGQTPLSWAAKRGHDAVVKLLLDHSS
jgi:ankyrin repeat protein